MSSTVISVENLSKSYRLGQIGTGTLTNDLKVWWAKKRGLPNPLLRIGQTDHGNRDGEELWALKDVSFQVEQGEVLGIIGRNGAGKSTLLKILSRVTAPTSGLVKVKGRIASLLEVGTGFHPELTGRENIYLNGAILGMSKQEIARKFDEIVAFAEIEKFIDTPVKRYSSGMYVRLAFAVAAHLESEILLVDEVLAVGDAEFQKKCLGKMGDVASKEGRTVLFVSHNMAAVTMLCRSSLLIDKGCITYTGLTLNTIDEYSRLNERRNVEIDDADQGGFHEIHISKNNFNNQLTAFQATGKLTLKEDLPRFQLYFIIQDEHGNNLVHSVKTEKNFPVPLIKGENQLQLDIPGLWLKPGYYKFHFKLMIEKGKGKTRILSAFLPFEVTYYEDNENLVGIINPIINWKVNFTESNGIQ